MAGHGGGEGEGGGELRWLLTYADLITLLLVYFVVMFAFSNTDLKKFQALAGSLRAAFGTADIEVLSGGRSPGLGVLSELPQMNREFLHISNVVSQMAREQGLQNSISVNMRRDGVVIGIATGVLFDSGSAEIRPESQKTLDAIAALLAPLSNEIRIAGHTDDISPVPDWPSNWELSTARAVTVVRYLAAHKIDARRLSAVGFGEYQPLLPNDTPEHRTLNRRVEILIVYPTQAESPVLGSGLLSPLEVTGNGVRARSETPSNLGSNTGAGKEH